MSASGILNSGAVIFYHPLDNSTEHTLSQDWIGSVEHGSTQIGSGLFANIGNTVSLNPTAEIDGGFTTVGLANAVKLTDNKFLITYSNTANTYAVRTVTTSGTSSGVTPIFGTEYIIGGKEIYRVNIAVLSPSSVLVMHNSGHPVTDRPFVRQLGINGTVITSGTSLLFGDIANFSSNICAIDSTRAFVAIGGSTTGYVAVVEYAGGVITSGNVVGLSDFSVMDSCDLLNPSGCVFSYKETGGAGSDGATRVVAISGITITEVGAPFEFTQTYDLGSNQGDKFNGQTTRLTDSKFMVFYCTSNVGNVRVGTVVGTNITFGNETTVIVWYAFGQCGRLTDDKVFLTYKNHDSYPVQSRARIGSIDGTTVTLGSTYAFSVEDPGDTDLMGPMNALAVIDPTSAFAFYTEHTASKRRARVLYLDTSGSSLLGSGYPSMSGHTRVTTCMWGRNLTAPVSTVTIERGYNIQMTSGSIGLGSGAAVWNDSAISGLMSSLNDGYPHFLVLDFENTSSDWALSTSIDGATWTNQGNQNSGSLSPVLADTSGQVSFTDPQPEQWIDEVVLWGGAKGTLAKFTDVQLGNLYSIALSGLAMNQYPTEGEAGATEISASGDLFINGVTSITASGDLFVEGHEPTTASGDFYLYGQDNISMSGDLFISALDDRAIYWADSTSNKIQRSLLDGSNIQDIVTSGLSFVLGLAIDDLNDHIYFSDRDDNKIERVNENGTDRVLIRTASVPNVRGLNVSQNLQKLYWLDSEDRVIRRSDLDGSNLETLISFGVDSLPTTMTIHDDGNKMYWTDGEVGSPVVKRASLNGTGEEVIISATGISDPRGLAVDTLNSKLYWADNTLGKIEETDLDGGNRSTIASITNPQVMAIDVSEGKLYIGNAVGKIFKMNLDGTSETEIVDTSGVIRAIDFGFLSFTSGLDKTATLYISGPNSISASGDLFLAVVNPMTGSGDLFIGGIDQITGSGDMFIDGVWGLNDSVDLFLSGPNQIVDSGNLFIGGQDNISSSGDLYTNGHVSIVASGDLFVAGPNQITTSGDLFISGPNQITASGDLVIVGMVPPSSGLTAKSFDWLLKTSDYNPQLIGTFEIAAASVNIQVWDVTNGTNTAMVIPSSGCYQIGNTGRWGWSTANLPTTQDYAKHYFYMMTSNTAETFDGQFILDLPEGAKWIHPSDSGNYLGVM